MGGRRVLLAILAGLTPAIQACTPDGDEAAAPAAASDPTETRIETLRRELRAERERSEALAAEVDWLRVQLDAGAAPAETVEPVEESSEPDETGGTATDHGHDEPWFDAGDLVARGIPDHRVERLQQSFEASEMDTLRLRDLAMREGWYRTPRYGAALRDLRRELRSEIGDEDYDLLLYASGRKNRVVISDVLGDSPGGRAGLQYGDVVISYDGERVFKAADLRDATVRGEPGEGIAMDVLRDGEPLRLYLPRGPIGAKLSASRRMPEVP